MWLNFGHWAVLGVAWPESWLHSIKKIRYLHLNPSHIPTHHMPQNSMYRHKIWHMSFIKHPGDWQLFFYLFKSTFLPLPSDSDICFITKEWWLGDYIPDSVWQQLQGAVSQGAPICTPAPWLPFWLKAGGNNCIFAAERRPSCGRSPLTLCH